MNTPRITNAVEPEREAPEPMPAEHQLEVVARTYHKLRQIGLTPDMALANAGRALGIGPDDTHMIGNRIAARLKVLGVPRADEQLSSACHLRTAERALRYDEVLADLGQLTTLKEAA